MNRLGLPAAEAAEVARSPLLADFEPALVMSHFVSAEEPENPLNARQIDRFAAVRQAVPGSARLALQLVGGLPARKAALRSCPPGLRPLRRQSDSRPQQSDASGDPASGPHRPDPGRADGDTVGYNAQWTAHGARRLAVVSVGYADGYPRAASATDAKRDTQSPRAPPSLPGCTAPSPGACRWT